MSLEVYREVWMDAPREVRDGASCWFQASFPSARQKRPVIGTPDRELAWALAGARTLTPAARQAAWELVARFETYPEARELAGCLAYALLLSERPAGPAERRKPFRPQADQRWAS